MNRRRFLKLASASGIGGLAGNSQPFTRITNSPTPPSKTKKSSPKDTPTLTSEQHGGIHVTQIRINPDPVKLPNQTTIHATVENTGGEARSKDIRITIDGEPIRIDGIPEDVFTVSLGPYEQTTRSFPVSFWADDLGTNVVRVGEKQKQFKVIRPTPITLPDFIETSGRYFTVNGNQVYFNGANLKYIESASKPYIDDIVCDAATQGMNILRTWACLDDYCERFGDQRYCEVGIHDNQAIQEKPGVYNEFALQKIDRLIYRAYQHGMRLIFTLVDRGTRTDESGTIGWYVTHSSSAETYDDFYTDNETRRMYKRFVNDLLNRRNTLTGVKYKNDPTIAIWELGNELLLQDPDEEDPGRILSEWYEEMGEYIKSIAPNQLVATGNRGMFNPKGKGRDYIRHNKIDAIDACSVHLYATPPFSPDSTTTCRPTSDPCDEVVQKFISKGHNEIGKPVYVGEFGPTEFGDVTIDESYRMTTDLYSKLYESFDQFDADGAMFNILWSDEYFTDERGKGHITAQAESVMGEVQQYSKTVREKSSPFSDPLPGSGAQNAPRDPDFDGLFEDVDGDGEFTIVDVQSIFSNRNDRAVTRNAKLFDFNDDGRFSIADVQRLYWMLMQR